MARSRSLKELLRGGASLAKPPAFVPVTPPAVRQDTPAPKKLDGSDNVYRLPLSLLNIPPYHGDRNPFVQKWRADALRANIRKSGGFREEQCEVLSVSHRKDGSYHVIDGVGRLYMADQLSGGLVKTLDCRVLTNLSYTQEIELFRKLGQQRQKITPRDAWLAQRGVRGHEEVDGIMSIIERQSPATLPKMTLQTQQFGWHCGAKIFETAIQIVGNTSLRLDRKQTNVITAAMIGVLKAHWDKLQRDDGTTRLREIFHPITKSDKGDLFVPRRLVDAALTWANDLGYKRPHARTQAWLLARMIVRQYNKGLAERKRLTESELAELHYADAFSSAPPTQLVPKIRKVSAA